ncbi:unnamed protein product [Ascophyllum nodosum]
MRWRYGWLKMDDTPRCAPLPSALHRRWWHARGRDQCRGEPIVVLYRVGTHQIRRGRRAAQSSTSQGITESLCARIKGGANREVSEGKTDRCLFSSYEGQQGAANGQDSWGFCMDGQRALDDWMLARAPTPPAQGFHHHGSRYFNFPYFCMMRDLEKLGLADQN